jgi:PAS domain S-box-containing protein
MKKVVGKNQTGVPLRLRAEDRLKENKLETGPISNEVDQKKLIHELQVHQIELEMQNEELKRARGETDEILAKYTDLYDFAPIGYLTFDEKAFILELNLTAAQLLGVERSLLFNRPFSSFIQREFQDRFYFHLQEVLESPVKQTCELVLNRKNNDSFNVQLVSIAIQTKGRRLVRSVITDITSRKQEEKTIHHLASFPELNPNPVMEIDASGELTYCNPAGYRVMENLGIDNNNFSAILPEDIKAIMSNWDKKATPNFSCEVYVQDRVLGETIQFVPEFKVARIYARDITERKKSQNRIASLAKLYMVLSRVNEIIVRTHDEGSLFMDVCHILAEEGGFPLVWIGIADEQNIIPVVSYGPATDYLREIKVEISGKLSKGPTGTSIRENRAVINDDFASNPAVSPWNEVASEYGFRASAAFPLRRQGMAIGAITIYALEPNVFDTEQIGLLESLSADISYALDAIHQEQLRVQSEENLVMVKETWERTFASVPDMIAILDTQHRVLRVNETMARRLGMKADECIGLPCHKLVHGLDTPPPFCPHYRTIKDNRPHIEEIHEERLGGDFEITTTPIYNNQGLIVGSVHVAHDVTERKQTEEKLRLEHERLEMAQRAAGAGTWDWDIISDNLEWSSQLFELFGLSPQKGISSFDIWNSVLHPDDRDTANLQIEEALREHTGLTSEYRIVLHNGQVRWISALGHGTYNKNGQPVRMRGICIDITDRKRLDIEIQKAYAELEDRVQQRTAELSDAYDELQAEVDERKKTEEALRQAHKMEAIGTLAGGIAHDFNNILAAIMGFTEMVIEDLPEGSEEAKHLRYVLKSVHRGKDLVKQILTFSRKSDYARGQISLTPLIKETVQLLRASIPSTIKIELKLTATLDMVLASPTEIQQMLMNLATNAALAMEEPGGTLEISLNNIDFQSESSAFAPNIKPGEYIQLAVRDTGSGMTPEVMKRIFEPFFTTREVGKGTGMGLAMVYGIVTDLQGAITVESEPGAGSLFRVFLPKAKPGVESESARDDTSPGGKERILFLDDEKLLVEWGHAALTRLGYKVTSMTDSMEALKIFSADHAQFDLVVTDQTMPNLTGIQLTQKLLKIRPDIPIVLCTGHGEIVTPEEAHAAGIREFLIKPVNKTKFARTIRRVLDQKSKE